MAFGRHWEWRGFGDVEPGLRCRVLALPLWFAPDQPTDDTYLWTPHCTANVKLRYGDLKFKRLLESDGDLEHWLEDEAEVYPFPLEPGTMVELSKLLGTRQPPLSQAVGRNQLADVLAAANPSFQTIRVEKMRRLHLWPQANQEAAIVELTEILAPEPITTLAVEHGDRASVRALISQLQPEMGTLRKLNYLQALSCWARSERIASAL